MGEPTQNANYHEFEDLPEGDRCFICRDDIDLMDYSSDWVVHQPPTELCGRRYHQMCFDNLDGAVLCPCSRIRINGERSQDYTRRMLVRLADHPDDQDQDS